jgi:hypothetical protein
LAAAIGDAATDELFATRVLVVVLVCAAALTALGHLVMILCTDRLR